MSTKYVKDNNDSKQSTPGTIRLPRCCHLTTLQVRWPGSYNPHKQKPCPTPVYRLSSCLFYPQSRTL